MEINYAIVIPAAVLAILLTIWLVRRNRKDKKKYEQQMNKAEDAPDQHT